MSEFYLECRKVGSVTLDPYRSLQDQVDEAEAQEGEGSFHFDMTWVILDENGDEISEDEYFVRIAEEEA